VIAEFQVRRIISGQFITFATLPYETNPRDIITFGPADFHHRHPARFASVKIARPS
jgi:hypothetical protein